MASRESVVKQCLVVPGVPKDTNLGEILRNNNTFGSCQVLRCEKIPGGEADTNLEKWILMFDKNTSRDLLSIVFFSV